MRFLHNAKLSTNAMFNCSYQLRIKKYFKFLLHICVLMSESSSMGKMIPGIFFLVCPPSKMKSCVMNRFAVQHKSPPDKKKWQKVWARDIPNRTLEGFVYRVGGRCIYYQVAQIGLVSPGDQPLHWVFLSKHKRQSHQLSPCYLKIH